VDERKLVKLVKQHGTGKWSQIAEKLDGRAGKQCRERWHNHLRPDIKVCQLFMVSNLYHISLYIFLLVVLRMFHSRKSKKKTMP